MKQMMIQNDKFNQRCLSCSQWLEVLDELNIGAMTIDISRKVTAINHCAQALIGVKADEAVGCDCREIFTGVPCMMTCIFETCGGHEFSDDVVFFSDEDKHEYKVTRIAAPMYDDRHQLAGCLTILQDHSPISDLIDRLRHEERLLKNILDSLDVGVFTVNRGGLLTFFNTTAEKISGFSRDQVLGKPCAEVFKGELFTNLFRFSDTARQDDPGCIQHGFLMDVYDNTIPIRVNYMALRNEKGAIVGGLATFADMTLVHQLKQAIDERCTFQDMIGKSPEMQRLFEMIPVVAESNATVLIEGPTGTGKDLLAKIIHSQSSRKGHPFVKINCAAVPENLLESEFFGYVKGAFTGAERDKPGRFQEADGGTILLDEIGDLPLILQAKLLRVLEDKEFYPLGGRKTQKVDVRIISATNRNLDSLVKKNLFREDLYYRLNVVRLDLPPLLQRREDLPLLIRHVLRKVSAVRALPPPSIAPEAMQILLNYTYPGNVREMENIIEHAMILCRGGIIENHHLPEYLHGTRKVASQQAPVFPILENSQNDITLISDALKRHHNHRGKTAKALGMDRTTLWRKMKRYGLDRNDGHLHKRK